MIYNVEDVANYIVNYSIDNNNLISNLKLQKILYYVQACFLVKEGTPCFNEDIEHWRHGPVVRQVYTNYKIYFNDKITCKEKHKRIKEVDQRLINKVVDSYKDYDAWELVEKTHNEEPWINTEPNEIIKTELIKEYFSENKEKILGC